MIEKAYAKLHGCYEALNGGLIDDGLVDLTGLVAEKIKVDEKNKTREGSDDLWRKLMSYKSDRTLLGCSIDGTAVESNVLDEDGESTGLMARHAYSIIDVLYVPNRNAKKGRYRLLRLRNPWGNKEWVGPWSDRSPELTANLEIVMKEMAKLGEDETFNPTDSSDGTFLMSYSDWKKYFTNLFACVDFPDEWSGVRFFGSWTK